MDNVSTEIKSQDIHIDKFFERFKIAIYSLIGIVVFFIPVNIDNQTKTIIHHIVYNLQINYRGFLEVCTIIYLILGVIKSIISDHKNKLTKIYSYLRVLSIFIIISIFYNKNSIILLDDTISLILEEMILNLVTLLPLSAIFMPFILDYGLLEIVEGYCHKLMKKTFNLSGKSVLNIIMYMFNDCFCGYFMTNLLYKKGKLRQNEVCIIILNFSIASIYVIDYIADEFNINKINFFILSLFILIVTNIILCRLYPINKKKKSYFIKTSYKETYFKNDKLNKSIKKYLQNKENTNIFKLIIGNLEESIHIIINLIPDLVLIIYLGDIIINNIDIIYYFKIVFDNILELLNFNNVDDISVFIINGFFNDIIAIENLNKNIQYTNKLLVSIICILKCTSLTTNILYLKNTNIIITKTDFFISYIQGIIVILIISAMIFYLYNIYTI